METQSSQKMKDKMVVIDPHLSVGTLNINGLNSPIKKHRVSGPSLVVQRLGLDLPTQEEQVQPLVGKLGSHMPHG